MTPPTEGEAIAMLAGSLGVRVVALGWSVVLLRRIRDWRLGLLSLTIAAMVLRQTLSLISLAYDGGVRFPGLTRFGTEFPGVGISLLVLVMVYFLGKLLEERRSVISSLKASEERYRRIFEEGPIGMGMSDMDGTIIEMNPMFCRMLGYEERELLGRSVFDITHPGDVEVNRQNIAQLRAGAIPFYTYDKRYVRKDGGDLWASVTVSAIRDEHGKPRFTLAMVRDITERKEAEARQQLMMNELDHRVKNNLATVVALAEQTLEKSASMGQFRAAFIGRLYAMARAHEALTHRRWEGADLCDIAAMILTPHHDNDGRVIISGPPLTLAADAALPLSLVLHELSTNALKYGSLASPAGRVAVSWRRTPEDDLQLTWQESGGAPVQPPERQGMGHALIEGLIGYQLRGQVEMAFDPAGLRCTIALPRPFASPAPAPRLNAGA